MKRLVLVCVISAWAVSAKAEPIGEWVLVIWEHGQPTLDNRFPSFDICETIRQGRIQELSSAVSPEALAREKAFRLTFPNGGIAQDFMDDAVKQYRASETLSPRQSEAVSVLEGTHPSALAEQQRLEALDVFKHHSICDYHPTHPFRNQPAGPSPDAK